ESPSIATPTSPELLYFFHDTATAEIYTLSLHDALPIFGVGRAAADRDPQPRVLHERRTVEGGQLRGRIGGDHAALRRHRAFGERSEEHTSELQSRGHLVCRLLLEKKKLEELLQGVLAPG